MTALEAILKLKHLHQIASGADDSIYTDAQRAWIDRLRRQELGEPVRTCSCKDRYKDAVIELLTHLKHTKTMQHERKYMLRRGIIIWMNNDAYSRHNLTDEVAEEYLKLHPDAASKFERLPEPETKTSPADATKGAEPNKEPLNEAKPAKTAEIKPNGGKTTKNKKTTTHK